MKSVSGIWAALAAMVLIVPATPALAQRGAAEIVVDAGSGRVLHAVDADRRRRPASIAKVMTLFLVFDALDRGQLRLDQRLKVSARAAGQAPTRLGLRAGATITVRDAMQAVAVKSANDAAVVLAEAVGRDEGRFAALMSAKARGLGMANTTFGNATGLPDRRTWTTARDIATLARAVLREHPDRYALFGQRAIRWRAQTWPNHNHLLGRVTGVDGIKTGYTVEAGYTLAASAKRGSQRLIAVALGFRSWGERDQRVGALLDDGFSRLRTRVAERQADRRVKVAQVDGKRRPG